MTPGRRPVLLALRALGLGDLLTALPALRALGEAFPDHRRVLATTAGVARLALYAGVADEVLEARPLERLAPRPASVDVAVNLHGRGPRSHRLLLDLSPRRLVAFGQGDIPGSQWRADEHEVHRWCRLMAESGIPADPTRLDLEPPQVAIPPSVARAAGATLIHPGAASPARRWPADRWAAVARAEQRDGRTVVVTGGPSEVGLARQVAEAAGIAPEAVLAGATDVVELAAVVAAAGRVLCGDTGVAHLATALGRPSVVLFGPVPPSRWGPPPERRQHVALWSGRTGDPHGLATDPGLLEISVADVTVALERLPEAVGAPRPPASRRPNWGRSVSYPALSDPSWRRVTPIRLLGTLAGDTDAMNDRNVFGAELEPCGDDPVTGFYRDGCCSTGPEDRGSHTICAVVTPEFLEHQRGIGNDLVTPVPQFRFPGLVPGDRWCVTAANWLRAHRDGAAAHVVLASTHERALEIVPLAALMEHAVDVPADPGGLDG